MKIFRIRWTRKLMAVFTGLVFLNMSFFMAEINALHLEKKNRNLLENIVRLVAGIGFEEEKDIFGDTSNESPTKEIDIFINYESQSARWYEMITRAHSNVAVKNKPLSGNFETFTPPPEA